MGRKNKGKNKQKQKQAAKVAATAVTVAKAAPSPFAGDAAVSKAAAETFPPPSPAPSPPPPPAQVQVEAAPVLSPPSPLASDENTAALLTQPYPLSPSPSVSSTDSLDSVVSHSAFLRGDDHALNHAFKVIKGEGFGDVFDAIELCAATSILQKGQILDAMEQQNTLLKDLLVFLNANKTKEEVEESKEAAAAAVSRAITTTKAAQEGQEDHLVDVGELVGVFEDNDDEDLSEAERQAMETEKVTAAVAAIERDEKYPSSIPAVTTTKTRQLNAVEDDDDDDEEDEEEQLHAVGKVAAATAAVAAATTAAVVTSREAPPEDESLETQSIDRSLNDDDVVAIEEIVLGSDAALALLTAVSESDSYDDTSTKNSEEYDDTDDVVEHDAVTSRAVVMEENDDDDMFEAVKSREVLVEEAPPAVTAVSDDESEDSNVSHDSMEDAIAAIEAASSFKEVAEDEGLQTRSLPPVATPAEDGDDEELANLCLIAIASKPVIAELNKNASENSAQKAELSKAIQEQNTSLEKLFTLLGGGSAADAVQAQWEDIAEEVENAEVDDDGSIASMASDASESTLANICLVAMATKPVIAELEKNATASKVQKAELTQAMTQQVTSLNKVLMLLQAQTQQGAEEEEEVEDDEPQASRSVVPAVAATTTVAAVVAASAADDDDDDDNDDVVEDDEEQNVWDVLAAVGVATVAAVGVGAVAAAAAASKDDEADKNDEQEDDDDEPQAARSVQAVAAPTRSVQAVTAPSRSVQAVAAPTTVATAAVEEVPQEEADDDDEHLSNMCLVAMASKPVIAELQKNATESSTQKEELSQALREQNASLQKLFVLLGGGSAADAVQAQWKDIAEEVENAEVDDDGSIASIASDASEGTLATICLVAMATKPVIAELEKNANASTVQKAEVTQAMKQQVTSLNKVLMLLQAQTKAAQAQAEPAGTKAVRQASLNKTAVFEDGSETSSSGAAPAPSKVKKQETKDTHLARSVAEYDNIVSPLSSPRDDNDIPTVEKTLSEDTDETDPLKEEEVVPVAARRAIPVADTSPPPPPPSPPSVVSVPKKKKLPSWNAGTTAGVAGAAAVAATAAGAAATGATWKFIESDDAIQRRTSKKKEALFGKVMLGKKMTVMKSGGNELRGDSFGYYWEQMRNDKVTFLGDTKAKAPKWATIVATDSEMKKKANVRSFLPLLALDGDTKIKLPNSKSKAKASTGSATNNGGVHYLTMKYENGQIKNKDIEAAVIVGEIMFDSTGMVLAQGADWKKLFAGKLQLKAQSTSNKMKKWYSHKVSDPWKDGDTLTFKLDLPKNTIGYTIRGASDNKVRSGWMFTNVLAYTNNRVSPNYLQLFAYVGGKQSLQNASKNKASQYENVKFTVVNAVANADDKKGKK